MFESSIITLAVCAQVFFCFCFQNCKKKIAETKTYILGCANKDLWGLCAPIFIIVVYSRTATSYFLGVKE